MALILLLSLLSLKSGLAPEDSQKRPDPKKLSLTLAVGSEGGGSVATRSRSGKEGRGSLGIGAHGDSLESKSFQSNNLSYQGGPSLRARAQGNLQEEDGSSMGSSTRSPFRHISLLDVLLPSHEVFKGISFEGGADLRDVQKVSGGFSGGHPVEGLSSDTSLEEMVVSPSAFTQRLSIPAASTASVINSRRPGAMSSSVLPVAPAAAAGVVGGALAPRNSIRSLRVPRARAALRRSLSTSRLSGSMLSSVSTDDEDALSRSDLSSSEQSSSSSEEDNDQESNQSTTSHSLASSEDSSSFSEEEDLDSSHSLSSSGHMALSEPEVNELGEDPSQASPAPSEVNSSSENEEEDVASQEPETTHGLRGVATRVWGGIRSYFSGWQNRGQQERDPASSSSSSSFDWDDWRRDDSDDDTSSSSSETESSANGPGSGIVEDDANIMCHERIGAFAADSHAQEVVFSDRPEEVERPRSPASLGSSIGAYEELDSFSGVYGRRGVDW